MVLFLRWAASIMLTKCCCKSEKKTMNKQWTTTKRYHTHKFFDNHYSWLWNLMDSTTRFWICSRLSQRRDIQAGVALLKEMKNRAPLPKAFVHDGLRVYDEAYQKELFTLKTPRIQNVRSISIGHQGLNSKVERLNGTMRDRETVMRGLDNADAG